MYSPLDISTLMEGAWGHGPLDNDGASDWKLEMGKAIANDIKSKLTGDDYNYKYYAIGMWKFIKERLETNYGFFTEDITQEMDSLVVATARRILSNPNKLMNTFKRPDIVKAHLELAAHVD